MVALGVALFARALVLRFERGAQLGVASHADREALEQRLDVEPAAADHERGPPRAWIVSTRLGRLPRIAAGVVLHVRVHACRTGGAARGRARPPTASRCPRRAAGTPASSRRSRSRRRSARPARGRPGSFRTRWGPSPRRPARGGAADRQGGAAPARRAQVRPKRRAISEAATGTATGRPCGQVGAQGIASSASASARCSAAGSTSPARRAEWQARLAKRRSAASSQRLPARGSRRRPARRAAAPRGCADRRADRAPPAARARRAPPPRSRRRAPPRSRARRPRRPAPPAPPATRARARASPPRAAAAAARPRRATPRAGSRRARVRGPRAGPRAAGRPCASSSR